MSKDNEIPYGTAYDIAINLCKYRMKKLNIDEVNHDSYEKEYCSILYVNKAFDNINFTRIFEKNMIYFPNSKIKIIKAFKYNRTLGRLMFNYRDCDVDGEGAICNCQKYKVFIDSHHSHVITGNLNIINNLKLRNLMNKGTKYRIQISNNINIVRKQIKKDINRFTLKIAVKYNLPYEAFEEFSYNVLKDIYRNALKADFGFLFKDMKKSIENLKNEFTITYVDKASGNFALICKKYYFEIIKDYMDNSNNYIKSKYQVTEIKNRLIAINKKLGYNINKINFPYVFITPKFHKNPVKFRTVTSGYNTYIVMASKKLMNITQQVINSFENTAIIKNSYDVINYMKDRVIYLVYGFDFEDLFNSINITDLIDILNKIYEK